MSFTVGLDFGTHQTKVCIEDASNPAQKLYEFVEFHNSYGKSSVLFPSIVQLNEDETVSYGFVDEEKCKFLHFDGTPKPKLNLLQKPVTLFCTEPQKPIFPNKPELKAHSWKEKLQSLFNHKKHKESPEILSWKEECKKLQDRYELALNECRIKNDILQKQHSEELEYCDIQNRRLEIEYHNLFQAWEKGIKEKLHYRYFKLATFSNSVDWSHEINSDIISVWYITYILFMLQGKLGENFFIQMGIPSGTNQTIMQKQKNKAFSILITAYKLLDKYGAKETFLAEKYQNLLKATELKYNYSEEDVIFYGLNVMPEAYAGLSSITQQKRLETGMSLLVDIGGGTTDVAFFTIRKNHPDIHSVISFPKGLNFIFENYIRQKEHLTISEVQNIFFEKQGSKSLFNASIIQYHNELCNQVKKVVSDITSSFELRKDIHQLSTSKLRVALENRPIVFCGGGAVYSSMQTSLLTFSDIKLINKNLLNIPFVRNQDIDDRLFTILATSYGLSIPLENEVILTPIEDIFNHIVAPESDKWDDYKYEHGLSDF